ncbi:MAG: hypothetical protein NZ521_06310, partial [Flammeovirgaceae bacterium]|nr:hypothetical protein [Flammeovirgaceae bacterium]
IARKRECSQFNCSYLEIKEVDDMVDAFWLLLNGCGVGFKPVPGKIKGFTMPVSQIDVIRRNSDDHSRGRETTLDWYKDGKWVLSIGDSAVS